MVLAGALAGLSWAAVPDVWRSGPAIAAIPEGLRAEIEAGAAAGAALARRGAERVDAGFDRIAIGKGVPRGEAEERVGGVRFARCGGGRRIDCVVDGDTFWMAGEKIRIADLNAPEVSNPGCASEARLGARATDALVDQLNAGPFTLERIDRDEDRYGRKLRRVTRGGESVGEEMVSAGVARWYGEGRRAWC